MAKYSHTFHTLHLHLAVGMGRVPVSLIEFHFSLWHIEKDLVMTNDVLKQALQCHCTSTFYLKTIFYRRGQ